MVATFSLYEINNPLNNSMGVTFKLPVFTANRNRTTRATAVMEKDKIIVVCLSGRGDKDVNTVQRYLNGEETNK